MSTTQQKDTISEFWTLPANNCRKFESGRRLIFQNEDSSLQSIEELVTVITVCYNTESTIRQTIESVLNQTYRNIEYIVIDGGSTDNTVSILRQYQYDIDYIVSEPDTGIYNAMNKGLSLAKGKYIIFINADDWYELDAIESLLNAYKGSGTSFVSACARKIGLDRADLGILGHMPYDDSMYFGMSIRHELMLVPTSIYQDVGGYDESYKIISDFEFALRLYKKGFSFYEVPRPLLNFRVSGVSNNDFKAIEDEHYRLIVKHFPFLSIADARTAANEQILTLDKIVEVSKKYLPESFFVKALLSYARRRQFFSSELATLENLLPYPRVSVIIPVYNAEATISRALDSVLSQDQVSLEVICIDDYSSDSSLEVLNQYAERDSRVKVLTNAHNQGVSATRNNGIRSAAGSFIFFLDADDRIAKDGLRTLLAACEDSNPDIIRGNTKFISQDGTETIKGYCVKERVIHTTAWIDQEQTRTTECFFGCLYKASIVKNILFRINLKMGEDSLFFTHALLAAQSISLFPVIVYEYIDTEGSAMRSYDLKKFCDELDWRLCAFKLLHSAGLIENASLLVKDYWNENVFSKIFDILNKDESKQFAAKYIKFIIDTRILPDKHSDSIPETCVNFWKIINEFNENNSLNVYESKNSMEKVAILSSAESGGAGVAAKRLFDSVYSDYRFKPSLYTRRNVSIDARVAHQNNVINGLATNTWFSISLEENSILSEGEEGFLRDLKKYDIVNTHWISNFLSVELLERIACENVPILIMMHDYWFLTGGCHYPAGCLNFMESVCFPCPQAHEQSVIQENIKKSYKRKLKILARTNVFIIAPSTFLLSETAKMLGLPVNSNKFHLLRNPFSPKLEFQERKSAVRSYLLICDTHRELRKGLDLAIDAFSKLTKLQSNIDESLFEINVVGEIEEDLIHRLHTEISAKVSIFGRINKLEKLEAVFQGSDFIIQSSFEDNWPNVLVEAGVHGCLPITLPSHGAEEFVHLYSSLPLVATSLSKDALYEVIKASLSISTEDLRYAQRDLARQIRADHSPEEVANQFYKILSSITNQLSLFKIFDKVEEKSLREKNSTNIRTVVDDSRIQKIHYYIRSILDGEEFIASSADLTSLSVASNIILQNRDLKFQVSIEPRSGSETINIFCLKVFQVLYDSGVTVVEIRHDYTSNSNALRYFIPTGSKILYSVNKPRNSYYGFPLLRVVPFLPEVE